MHASVGPLGLSSVVSSTVIQSRQVKKIIPGAFLVPGAVQGEATIPMFGGIFSGFYSAFAKPQMFFIFFCLYALELSFRQTVCGRCPNLWPPFLVPSAGIPKGGKPLAEAGGYCRSERVAPGWKGFSTLLGA